MNTDVKTFGAKGDGSTDDTSACQRAIDACLFGSRMELVFTSGLYLISDTLIFPSQLHIRGEGGGNNTMIRMIRDRDVFRTSGANTALNAKAAPNDWDHFLLVENLHVDCGDSASNAGITLCRPGEVAVLRNLSIIGGEYGIRCFGVGAPGLRVRDCSTMGQAVAGVAIHGRMPDGRDAGGQGPVSIQSLSGDHHGGSDTASLLLIDDCCPTVSLNDFKAEGQWGGGLVRYLCAAEDWPSAFGSLTINGGTYNCGGDSQAPCDLVVLQGKARSASLYINPLNLYGVRHLIRDEVTGRNVGTDTVILSGTDQTTCRLPVAYESMTGRSRLVVGGCACYDLYPPSVGWYRVMANMQPVMMGGRLVINTFCEATDLSFDVDCKTGDALLSVHRASKNGGVRVTQARAGSYSLWDGTPIAFLDIFVERLPSYDYECISLAHPIEGSALRGSGMVQLLTPTDVVDGLVPKGCVLNQCVTNSLTR